MQQSQPSLEVPETEVLADIDYNNIRKAAFILRALNHDLRKRIIETVYSNKRIFVTDLYVKLRLEQAVASQHLGILRKAGILTTKREGKFIYYSVNEERVKLINDLSKQMTA